MGGRRSGARPGRWLVRALAALAVLAALVVIVGPRLVPGDRLAARAAEALAAATGARVTVERAAATLVGGPGLRLRGVRLDGGPAWQATCESAEVSLEVAPLLGRRLVVDRLAARGPQLTALAGGRPLTLAGFAVEAKGLGLVLVDPAVTAPATAPLSAGLPATRLPAGLGGKVVVQADHLAVGAFALAAVTAEIRPDGRRFVVSSLAAQCGGGELAADGALDLGVVPGAWEATLRLKGVEAAALLGEWAPEVASRLDVSLDGNARAAGAAAGGAALATLRADARLDGGGGLVRAGAWLAGAEPYLGDRQDLVDVKLSGARLVARLEDGRCRVDTLALRGPDTDWDLAGTLDVVAPAAGAPPALELGVHLRLPPGFTPELGAMRFFAEAMRDRDGRINLDLALRGPLAEPVVTLDLAAMSRRLQRK